MTNHLHGLARNVPGEAQDHPTLGAQYALDLGASLPLKRKGTDLDLA